MWNINLEQAESSSAPEEIREIYWHQNVEKGSTAGQKNQQTQNWQGRGWGEARLRPHWPPATYLSFRPRPTLSPYIRSRWPRRSAFTFLCTGSSARACAVSCRPGIEFKWAIESSGQFVCMFVCLKSGFRKIKNNKKIKSGFRSPTACCPSHVGFRGLCGRSNYHPHFPVPSVSSDRVKSSEVL